MLLNDFEICADSAFIIRIVIKVIKIIRIAIPILIILLVTFDLFKVVSSNPDDKGKKEALEKIVKRLVYAVIIFLIPTIVNLIFTAIEEKLTPDGSISSTPTTGLGCWNKIYNDPTY